MTKVVLMPIARIGISWLNADNAGKAFYGMSKVVLSVVNRVHQDRTAPANTNPPDTRISLKTNVNRNSPFGCECIDGLTEMM